MDNDNPTPPSDDKATEAQSPESDSSFGPWLRRARAAKNISLEEIAAVTKVHISQLAHLEAEEFHKLPAAAFVRGFLINYARYLELDEDEVLTRFRRASGADKRDAEAPKAIRAAQSASQARVKVVDFPNFQNAPSARARDPEPSKVFNGRNALVTGLVIVGIGLLVFLISLGRKAAKPAPPETPVAAAPEATAVTVDVPATPSVVVSPPPQTIPPKPAATPALAPSASVAAVAPTAAPEAKKNFEFEIRALEPTWLSVRTDDDDAKGITLQPGKPHGGSAHRRINLSLSNAGVVEIRWGNTWYESPGFRGDVKALQLPDQLGELKPKSAAAAKPTPKRVPPPAVPARAEAPAETPSPAAPSAPSAPSE
jgi:cytoskeleton protein RodZ